MSNSKRRCFSCKEYFIVETMIIVPIGALCSNDCIQDVITKDRLKKQEQAKKQLEWQKKQNKKINAKIKKMRKDKNDNDKSLRTRTAQKAFNAFIRKRDEKLPCISCGKEKVAYTRGGQWDCGHFLGVGAHLELRFNEDNAHKQCKKCNGGAGKYAKKNHTVSKEYKINLIKKIGQERVDFLEGKHEIPKLTCKQLKEIELKYKKKLKELNELD